MKSIKLAVIAALSSFAVSAFALSPMQDSDLSAVSGQDGVSIAAQMNINVGEFKYTTNNTDASKVATMQMGNISITGAIAATIDILTYGQFVAEEVSVLGVSAAATGALRNLATAAVGNGLAAAANFAPTSDDVVRIAIPTIGANKVNITVGSMSFGDGTSTSASGVVGKMEIKDLQLQGTTAYIWLHKG